MKLTALLVGVVLCSAGFSAAATVYVFNLAGDGQDLALVDVSGNPRSGGFAALYTFGAGRGNPPLAPFSAAENGDNGLLASVALTPGNNPVGKSRDARKELKLQNRVELYEISNDRREALRSATGQSWSVAPSKRWIGVKAAAGKGLLHGYLEPDAADHASGLIQAAEILKDDLEAIADALTDAELPSGHQGATSTIRPPS